MVAEGAVESPQRALGHHHVIIQQHQKPNEGVVSGLWEGGSFFFRSKERAASDLPSARREACVMIDA